MPETGLPEQGESLVIQVSATSTGTATPVYGLTRYSRRKSRPINRTSAFMRASPYVSRGEKDTGFTLSGVLKMLDPGQQILRDAVDSGASVFVTILPDGLNGFSQEVLVSSLSHDANPDNLQEHGFECTGVDVEVEVLTGPVI